MMFNVVMGDTGGDGVKPIKKSLKVGITRLQDKVNTLFPVTW